MLMRVFTLRFDAARDGFDDGPVTEFIKDKAVLSLREHFFMRNETPYMAIVVTYEPVREAAQPSRSGGRQRDESWRELLTDQDMPLFNALRSWRAERCKAEGVPPYVIGTNKQLAAIAHARPQTLADLMKIEGFGKAKADKYGAAMLGFCTTPSATSSAPFLKKGDLRQLGLPNGQGQPWCRPAGARLCTAPPLLSEMRYPPLF